MNDPFEEAAPAPEPAWRLQAIEEMAKELGISVKAARRRINEWHRAPHPLDDDFHWDGDF